MMMIVLITYDIQTLDREGRRRLRRISKACLSFGQRVQFSVFECRLPEALWVGLKAKLLEILDPETDSLRFYFLGEDDLRTAEHHGVKPSVDYQAPLVL
jgi:CRISPR-associated protein Cas2